MTRRWDRRDDAFRFTTARGRAMRCATACSNHLDVGGDEDDATRRDVGDETPVKAFACAWLDERSALVSTKCNRLFRMDFRRRGGDQVDWREIELGRISEEDSARLADARARARAHAGDMRREIVEYIRHPQRGWNAGGLASVLAYEESDDEENADRLAPPIPYDGAHGGAHAIAQTKDRLRLCVSGGPQHDIVGFERRGECDDIVPTYALRGHEDVVFGIDFINRDTLASASRDCSLKVFRLPRETSDEYIIHRRPVVTITFDGFWGEPQSEKLRGVKLVYNSPSPQLAAITSSGMVHQFDAATLHAVGEGYKLQGFAETTCMATDGRIVAVGSRTHIGFVDFRMRGVIDSIAATSGANEASRTTRSLSFRESILTIGGGRGNVEFFDTRKCEYLKRPDGRERTLSHPQLSDDEPAPAILSHEWDPTGTRLLVAGGPLLESVPGFYVGLWR